jgi:hypothetical protein
VLGGWVGGGGRGQRGCVCVFVCVCEHLAIVHLLPCPAGAPSLRLPHGACWHATPLMRARVCVRVCVHGAGLRQLPEQLELIWADACAPEACIDFDAPHVPTSEGIKWWLGGFAAFAGLYQLAGLTNPKEKKTTVRGCLPVSPCPWRGLLSRLLYASRLFTAWVCCCCCCPLSWAVPQVKRTSTIPAEWLSGTGGYEANTKPIHLTK